LRSFTSGWVLTMSTSSSSELSVASTKINGEAKPPKERQSRARKAVSHAAQATTSQDLLLFLVAFRILNALTIRTFFQPDEYFQSLEPAWRMVFGKESGAWITWVCIAQLRGVSNSSNLTMS
jgi:GPI mannosyltransferase 3